MSLSRLQSKNIPHFVFCLILCIIPFTNQAVYQPKTEKEWFNDQFRDFCKKSIAQELREILKKKLYTFGPITTEEFAKMNAGQREKLLANRRTAIAQWLMEHMQRIIAAEPKNKNQPALKTQSFWGIFTLTGSDKKRSDFFDRYKKIAQEEWAEKRKKNGTPIPTNLQEEFDNFTLTIMAEMISKIADNATPKTSSGETNRVDTVEKKFKLNTSPLKDMFFEKHGYRLIEKGINGN